LIRVIEALNYRCLQYVHQTLDDFRILIGPNASGKTTFLDVVGFLGDLLSEGLDSAITNRSTDLHDLFFMGRGNRFELAVELEVPADRVQMLPAKREYSLVRYEVAVGLSPESDEYHILDEQVVLTNSRSEGPVRSKTRDLFPNPAPSPKTIMHPRTVGRNKHRAVRKVYEGNDNFYSEKGKGAGSKWAPSIRLGPRKSALANMPADEEQFPISTWLRETLINGTQRLMLNSLALRESSRPGQGRMFKPDGSNLPWVIESLRSRSPERFGLWIEQLQTALPDIQDIRTVELPDTKHRFLQIIYPGGLKVPSWTASDGTLRMLALTLPAYLPDFEGIYLIEEPENGIHPMAMETVYQALKAVYRAQILLATHSPVILGCATADEILCFKKDDTGATDVVTGSCHPALRQWQDSLNLSDLYASGVLG
jgi:predicted ATPase